jgi:hypothetical protein
MSWQPGGARGGVGVFRTCYDSTDQQKRNRLATNGSTPMMIDQEKSLLHVSEGTII